MGAAGFEATFVTHERGNLIVVARPAERDQAFTPMSDEQHDQRLAKYSQARDLAILRVPCGDDTRREAAADARSRTRAGGLARVVVRCDSSAPERVVVH